MATKFSRYEYEYVYEYVNWGEIKARVYKSNLAEIESFQDATEEEWKAYPQVNIKNAIIPLKNDCITQANSRCIEQHK